MALEEFYAKDAALRGKKIETGKAAEDKARRESVDASQKAYAKRTQDAAIADDEAFSDSKSRYLGAYTKRSRFADLSKRVERGETLHPSEAKEYTRLSKELDEAKAKKAGKGHKQTKMDKQLAAIDPSLRGVLTGGGETDAGGDLRCVPIGEVGNGDLGNGSVYPVAALPAKPEVFRVTVTATVGTIDRRFEAIYDTRPNPGPQLLSWRRLRGED